MFNIFFNLLTGILSELCTIMTILQDRPLLVSFTNFLHFHDTNYYSFICAWWNSCSISYTADFLVMNTFSFVLLLFLWYVFNISYFWRVDFLDTIFFLDSVIFFLYLNTSSLSPGLQSFYWEVALECYDGVLHVVTFFFSCCFKNCLCLWP